MLDRLAIGAHQLVIDGPSYRAKLAPRPPSTEAACLDHYTTTKLLETGITLAILPGLTAAIDTMSGTGEAQGAFLGCVRAHWRRGPRRTRRGGSTL